MTILEFFRRAFNINPKEVKIVEVTNNLNEEILRGGIIDTPDETTIEKKVIKEEVIKEEVIKEEVIEEEVIEEEVIEEEVIEEEVIEEVIEEVLETPQVQQEIKVKKLGKLAQRRLRQQK